MDYFKSHKAFDIFSSWGSKIIATIVNEEEKELTGLFISGVSNLS